MREAASDRRAAGTSAGFALHVYLGSSADAAPSTSLPTLAPGGMVITDTTLAVGATCRPRLYWQRLEDGLFQAVGEKPPFTIQGLTQPQGGTGERFGLIRFGSRLDLYLPEGVAPLVAVGLSWVARGASDLLPTQGPIRPRTKAGAT